MLEEKKTSINFNGEELHFSTGKLAQKADSTVKVQLGETVVLAIVTVDKAETTLDYFPLSVEYIEKFYAGGIISNSRFVKRERRPSDDAVLKARQVDHSIRSLFPKGFKKAVSVVITVLSYDEVHDPTNLAVTAASSALMLSSVPFNGPSAGVSIGIKEDDSFVLNPKDGDSENYKGEYIISFKEDRVLNIEGYSDQVSEEKMGELMDFAADAVKPLFEIQEKFAKENSKEKMNFEEKVVTEEILKKVEEKYGKEIDEALYNEDRRDLHAAIAAKVVEEHEGEISKDDAMTAVDYLARKYMRKAILESEKRVSGRKLDEIREIDVETGVLPRVHGSALFTRGITQAMSIVTLGSTRLSQTLESFEGEETKRFMHHYNGPSYSLGEAGRFSYYPGRREIGHGHISENAFKKILPSEEDFPYTIRVVSEILSQNGSSSMAAACGTSLALMDTGVPIKEQVAGIAVGLVTDDEDLTKYKLVVDMQDVEDFYGDMDFKVVGTKNGITAIQLDNKLEGVPIAILKDAFEKSKAGREHVLSKMNAVIAEPKPELSENAPKVDKLKIDQEKIGELIGPGGKNIRSIIEEAEEFGEIDIDIQEDGNVYITAVNKAARDKALELIGEVFEEAEIGKVYDGVVDRVEAYGAFVDVTKNISGLVHVSEMSDSFVKDVNSIVKVGDKVKVKVIGIDDMGRVKMSMKGLNKPETKEAS
ncbi:polyribonucleotide nucleotidyltransferase [Candidatus Dojkabacteria bacterium]|nr:polyribonucleotide nucleotidyltransferase [Candidatus Dojkabacteria bacterium]